MEYNTNGKPYAQLISETNSLPSYEEIRAQSQVPPQPEEPTSQSQALIPPQAPAPIMQPQPSIVHNVNYPAMGGGMPGPPSMFSTNPPVGPHSTTLNCPQCRVRINTQVRHRSTAKTHIACLLLAWTLCCCCLPYCMNSCRNANHFCPMCGSFIGTYQS